MQKFLYHGTGYVALQAILKDGFIAPRGQREGNWDPTIPSNPDAVYLTTVYSIFYANGASSNHDNRLVIIEVDRALLLDSKMAPDEDFLEQATRKGADPQVSTVARVAQYRDRTRREFQAMWPSSLEHLGTCCYFGQIPIAAISRIAIIPRTHPIALASDPIVCLPNHAVMGAYYRNLTKRVFGDVDYEQEVLPSAFAVADIPRSGILVCSGATGEFEEVSD